MQLYTKENNTLYFSRQYKDKGAKVNFYYRKTVYSLAQKNFA